MGIEGIALGNTDWQTLRVDPLVRVTVFAAQDRVTKAPAIRTSETSREKLMKKPVDWGMGDVMVNKLSPLHHHQRVANVRS